MVTKTDGVPLFIEELTKTVLESGLVEEDVRTVTNWPGPYHHWPYRIRCTTR